MSKKQTILIMPITAFEGSGRSYIAVSESYEILAEHFCSNDEFALLDLSSPNRVKFYKSLHPEGLEPEFRFVSELDKLEEVFSMVMKRAFKSRELKEIDGEI